MTVDTHHHLWDLDVRDQPWITGAEMEPLRRDFRPADLQAALKGSGVDATVLVQTVSDPDETPEMLVLADSVDRIAAVVGWVDLTTRDVRERIGRLQTHPSGGWLKGIRHQVEGEPDPDWLVRPEVLNGLAAVEDAGLVYELLVRTDQLPAAIKAVGQFPQLTFVLDHCAKPPVASGELQPWADRVRALAAHPNVVCKLSGLVTEDDWTRQPDPVSLQPYVDVVLEAFGPRRLMFGSDWPVCLLAAEYGQVIDLARQLTAGLDDRRRSAVFDANAREVYDI
ncbi:L-fuconolactonase [Saccharopolyspora antimicrobica]|uniref:L-fuconolactonase n=1 Tax=Saccharopolyspora antimicrobica TaxID=455193 RepID=A0A1I5J095_9PSEU|nr:amidohydrolase family protein [Saccharopolyspora antimicrobica]RKT83821.1 L-fuconolactonase [Saccharopolyspora antimicrobica]SFO66053.1 L-fuconolactonase [Saccharopolyspora antimicrobica]